MIDSSKAPKRRKKIRKTVYLRVRVTPEQDQLFRDAATHAGITVSAWVAERLVRAAREDRARAWTEAGAEAREPGAWPVR